MRRVHRLLTTPVIVVLFDIGTGAMWCHIWTLTAPTVIGSLANSNYLSYSNTAATRSIVEIFRKLSSVFFVPWVSCTPSPPPWILSVFSNKKVLQKLQEMETEHDFILVWLDFESLYTSIPHRMGVEACRCMLERGYKDLEKHILLVSMRNFFL